LNGGIHTLIWGKLEQEAKSPIKFGSFTENPYIFAGVIEIKIKNYGKDH
jgi:hypothetical protein